MNLKSWNLLSTLLQRPPGPHEVFEAPARDGSSTRRAALEYPGPVRCFRGLGFWIWGLGLRIQGTACLVHPSTGSSGPKSA